MSWMVNGSGPLTRLPTRCAQTPQSHLHWTLQGLTESQTLPSVFLSSGPHIAVNLIAVAFAAGWLDAVAA